MPEPHIVWESAGHDDAPGDQNGDTTLVSHGYWSLGEAGGGRFNVELIAQDAQLQEIKTISLGEFETEEAAKAAAEEYENDLTHQRFDADNPASVTVEVDVFPYPGQSLSLREVAERGMQLIRELEAPVVDVAFQLEGEGSFIVRIDTGDDPDPDMVIGSVPAPKGLPAAAPLPTPHPRLKPTELLTVRAADVVFTHVVELPRLVYMWLPKDSNGGVPTNHGWVARLTANEPRLAKPTWHFVYDAFDVTDAGTSYAADVDALHLLEGLQERYVLWRIGAEWPADEGHEDLWVAVHEYELVRVQAISEE